MRSEMKKVARAIVVAEYNILPTDINDNNEYEQEICANVETLLKDGAFLRDGVDAYVGQRGTGSMVVWLLTWMTCTRAGPTTLQATLSAAFVCPIFTRARMRLRRHFQTSLLMLSPRVPWHLQQLRYVVPGCMLVCAHR